jgi:E3 ubiquitin-protein ligase BRE1
VEGTEVAASTASHDAAPAPAMSAMITENQNEDVRRRADVVLSANNSDKNSSATKTRTQERSASSATTPSSATSSSSMKRQRNSREPKIPYPVPSDDEDETQQSSFFLKHQNRALASELKALQYQLSLLESERSYRRQQCRIASQALNSLQATWTQMETELQQQPLHALNNSDSRDAAPFVEQDAPMSTGKGNNVEIVGALFDALASLANTPPTAAPRRDQENGDDDDEDVPNRPETEELDPVEKQQLDDLSNISWNILQRANTLEEWIRRMLQKLTNSAGADGSQMTMSTSDQKALSKEIGILRGQCREYKIQIAELAKARDDTAKSERKVRRGIYRLSTGRVKIEQVLKDMEKSDEDGTLAAEAKMEALAAEAPMASSSSQIQSGSTSLDDVSGIKQESGTGVDSQDVQRIRKQLEEMEQQLATRDTTIEEVRK